MEKNCPENSFILKRKEKKNLDQNFKTKLTSC